MLGKIAELLGSIASSIVRAEESLGAKKGPQKKEQVIKETDSKLRRLGMLPPTAKGVSPDILVKIIAVIEAVLDLLKALGIIPGYVHSDAPTPPKGVEVPGKE